MCNIKIKHLAATNSKLTAEEGGIFMFPLTLCRYEIFPYSLLNNYRVKVRLLLSISHVWLRRWPGMSAQLVKRRSSAPASASRWSNDSANSASSLQ